MTRKPKPASLTRKTQAHQAAIARRKSAPAPAARAGAAAAKSADAHGAHKKAATAARPAVALKPTSGLKPAAALKAAPSDKPTDKAHDKSAHAGHKHAAASPAAAAAEPRRGPVSYTHLDVYKRQILQRASYFIRVRNSMGCMKRDWRDRASSVCWWSRDTWTRCDCIRNR